MFMLNFSNNALNFSHPTGGYQTGGLPAVQNGALQGFSWGDKNLPAVQDHAFDLGGPTGLPAVQYEPVDLGGGRAHIRLLHLRVVPLDTFADLGCKDDWIVTAGEALTSGRCACGWTRAPASAFGGGSSSQWSDFK